MASLPLNRDEALSPIPHTNTYIWMIMSMLIMTIVFKTCIAVSMATAVIWSSLSLKAQDKEAPTRYLRFYHFTRLTMMSTITQLLLRESQPRPWARWWGGRWRGWCRHPRWGWRARWARWTGRWSSPSRSLLLATSTFSNVCIFQYLKVSASFKIICRPDPHAKGCWEDERDQREDQLAKRYHQSTL